MNNKYIAERLRQLADKIESDEAGDAECVFQRELVETEPKNGCKCYRAPIVSNYHISVVETEGKFQLSPMQIKEAVMKGLEQANKRH